MSCDHVQIPKVEMVAFKLHCCTPDLDSHPQSAQVIPRTLLPHPMFLWSQTPSTHSNTRFVLHKLLCVHRWHWWSWPSLSCTAAPVERYLSMIPLVNQLTLQYLLETPYQIMISTLGPRLIHELSPTKPWPNCDGGGKRPMACHYEYVCYVLYYWLQTNPSL